MNRSLPFHTAAARLGTAGLVLTAFAAGHLAAEWGTSPVDAKIAAALGLGALVAASALRWHRTAHHSTGQDSPVQDSPGQNSTGQNSTGHESSRTVPSGVNTFTVVCSPPASEGVLAVIQDVIDGMVRPTDLVVRHSDGRLLLLVDAAGDEVRESFESRANVHVHVALAAAGLSPVGLSLLPVGSNGPQGS